MTRIERIETIRLAEHPRTLWVEVHTDDGLVGLGETYYVPGAVAAVIHDIAAPHLLGSSPFDIERAWTTLFQETNFYGYAGAEMRAISALDIALWDIVGQACGQPIYKLLGGQVRDSIRTYNTCASYGDIRDYEAFHERPDELAESLLAEGITAMKIWPFDVFARRPSTQESEHQHRRQGTVGSARTLVGLADGQYISPADIDQGVEAVRRIRKAVGSRVEIAIEMHAMWNYPSAVRIARALEPYDLMWLEEPMTPDPIEDLARLAREVRIPLCISERLFTRYAFRRVLELGAAHIVMPDIIWTGGISEGRKIATMAEAYHLPIAPHDCTGPVNVFACLHLCASAPNAQFMETVRAFYRGYYGDIVDPTIEVRDGHVQFPVAPGLGTRLRPEVRQRSDASVQSSALS
jgi:L-alanine-DL-glutamate epimerase-like enolase superfamily enzyme